MEAINDLLEDTQLISLKDAGLTIVSIFGNSGFRSTAANANGKLSNINVTLANRIVGTEVFVPNGQTPLNNVVELSKDLQLYVDHSAKIAYVFMDASIDTASLADACRNEKANDFSKNFMQILLSNQQSLSMRGLLLMFLISHLVIPILPPRLLPSEFMSNLVTLAQVKNGIYTHLAQLQSVCWKFWDISVPSTLFERKEIENRRDRERLNSNLMGWWGPAKGVPVMVFIAADVSIPNMDKMTRSTLPIAMKRMQEVVQARIKNIFKAFHFVPSGDIGIGRDPVEVRSLFTLPTTSQPFVHIVPATSFATTLPFNDQIQTTSISSFDKPMSMSAWLKENDGEDDDLERNSSSSSIIKGTTPTIVGKQSNLKRNKESSKQSIESMFDDCGNKLLRNFVSHWTRAATTRHPMHLQMIASSGSRKGGNNESKYSSVPLPTGIQFASAALLLKKVLFSTREDVVDDENDLRKEIIAHSPGTKGMIQQIEVILRKKIRDTVDIERVFSRSHSLDIMRKCIEAYLQDSPPCYTKQYHLWKRDNVLHMYNSLARGPCRAEFGARLERECDLIWKQGRQSCEKISLTGKVCRLKAGHEDMINGTEKHARDMDNTKHSSGCSFFHACNCGKTQKLREDPFDLEEANVSFYERFSCCLANGHAAIDLEKSTLGEDQTLIKNEQHIPHFDSVLLHLGPASVYRNSIGLEKYEGFMNNTNYLLPWTMGRTADYAPNEQQLSTTAHLNGAELSHSRKSSNNPGVSKSSSGITNEETKSKNSFNKNEWPLPGRRPEAAMENKGKASIPTVANLDAFPALGTSRTTIEPNPAAVQQELKGEESSLPPPSHPAKKEKRRRDGKRRDREHRLEGLIRGYVGAEYECPLGHRFLSCGDGRICKLGHKGHPKEHANYVIHQDLPLYVLCPCNYANANQKTSTTGDITAQLQRCYAVTPEAPVTISFKPRVKITNDLGETMEFNMGIDEAIILPTNTVHVFRLPYIYKDNTGNPIPVPANVARRLSGAILMKDCFQVHPVLSNNTNSGQETR